MQTKWTRALLPVLYVVWALYVLDIPDMPNPHAADIGFVGLWAFRSLNVVGGALFILLVQVCWHVHAWFFSPNFQRLSRGEFISLTTAILALGIFQWVGVSVLLERLYRAIRRARSTVSQT